MILEQTNDILSTNIGRGSDFKMLATAHSFKILSDGLYSDKIGAVIREISCNAYDAHVASGQTKKFIVSLPSQMNPSFSVEDFGNGLSQNDVDNLYTTYFASSKTKTNDQIGGFGIGCKSPFSYTDSFTVTSVYGNNQDDYRQKNVYLLSLREGLPTCLLVSSEKTTQHTGVKVGISVRHSDINEFNLKARRQLSFFPEESIQINGDFQRIKTTDNGFGMLMLESGNPLRGWFAKQGSVLYTMGSDVVDSSFHKIFGNQSLVLEFQTGELSVTPSRETLSLDEKTRQNLLQKTKAIASRYFETIYKDFFENKVVDIKLANLAKTCTTGVWGYSEFYFNSIEKIGMTTFSFENKVSDNTHGRVVFLFNRKSSSGRILDNAKVTQIREYNTGSSSKEKVVMIHDEKDKTFRQKIKNYMRNNGLTKVLAVMPSAKDIPGILGGLEVVDINTLPDAPKTPRDNTTAGRTSRTIFVSNAGRELVKKELTEEELDDLIQEGFYYAFVKHGKVMDNKTQEYDQDSKVLDHEFLVRQNYEDFTVVYLTSASKKIAKHGMNLIEELSQKAEALTMNDFYVEFANLIERFKVADIKVDKTTSGAYDYRALNKNFYNLREQAKQSLVKIYSQMTDFQKLLAFDDDVSVYCLPSIGVDRDGIKKIRMKFYQDYKKMIQATKAVDTNTVV